MATLVTSIGPVENITRAYRGQAAVARAAAGAAAIRAAIRGAPASAAMTSLDRETGQVMGRMAEGGGVGGVRAALGPGPSTTTPGGVSRPSIGRTHSTSRSR